MDAEMKKTTAEELEESTKALKNQIKLAQFDKFEKEMEKMRSERIKNVDEVDILEERLSKFNNEYEIERLTDEKVDALLKLENGSSIEINLAGIPKKDKYIFIKDYFKFLYTSKKQMESIDEEMKALQKDFEESNKEMEDIYREVIANRNVYREELVKAIESAKEEGKDEVTDSFVEQLRCFDVIPKLEDVFEHYKTLKNPENSYRDFKSASQRERYYKDYLKISEKMGLSTNIGKYRIFEEKCLPDIYHGDSGLFVFLIMKYISNMNRFKGVYKIREGLFIAQLAIMMDECMSGNLEEDVKNQFIEYVKDIVDIVAPKTEVCKKCMEMKEFATR